MKVDLGFGLKMVKACDPGARLKMVKVPRLPDPYLPPVYDSQGSGGPKPNRLILPTAVSKAGQKVHFWSIHRMAAHTRPPGPGVLDLCPQTQWRHSAPDGECRRHATHVWRRSGGSQCSPQSSRRSRTWRELTSYFLLRPRGASLLAQTGRSEQGDVRSQSRWPRLDPPPPPFHRTHGLRRTTCGMAAASRGSHDRGRVKLSRTASNPT